MLSSLTSSPAFRGQIVTSTVTETQTATGPPTYNLQVGANVDVGLFGSMGVRAEIRLHIYHVSPLESDAFWVGAILNGGAFIQFGYELNTAGSYCSSGEVDPGTSFSCSIGVQFANGSEPLWFWEYFPENSSSHFYFGQGSLGSSGVNGSWHLYSIIPNSQSEWGFLLDGHQVSGASFPTTISRSIFVVAEKITGSTQPGPLGPVEFRNLAYLKPDGWHFVSALYAIVGCGANSDCIPISYGVCLEGANHFIAGTSIIQPLRGQTLWDASTQSSEIGSCLSSPSLATTIISVSPYLAGAMAAVELLILFAIYIRIHRRKRRNSSQ